MKALVMALCLVGLFGCAGAPPPPARTVRVTEMARLRSEFEGLAEGAATPERALARLLPLAIEFRKGDRVPTRLFIGGNLVATAEDAPTTEIVVLRDFTMILYADRPPEFFYPGGRRHGIEDFHGAIQIGAGASRDEETPPLTLGLTVNSEAD